jgi:hypothetical protein
MVQGFKVSMKFRGFTGGTEHFRSFYLGFISESIIWFAYMDDDNNFETLFSFDDIHRDDESRIAFVEMIKPGLLLPVSMEKIN